MADRKTGDPRGNLSCHRPEGADGLRMGTVAREAGVSSAPCTTTSTPAPTC
jgi:hypothetical protein